MKRGSGAIRMGMACALLFASLSLVVWRQSRALEELRALDAVRVERAMLQGERSELQREIQRLESYTRIVSASARLGLGPAGSDQIQFLKVPMPATMPVATGDAGAARYSRVEAR